jgi:uncharacterized protein (TIGR03000 family)
MKKFFALGLGVIAVAIVLGTPGISNASGGIKLGFGYGYGPGWGYGPYYGPYYPGYFYRPVTVYIVQAPVVVAANTARIRVTVPADAKVWVDDQLSMQTGTERSFESPQLALGWDYSYDIKALWRDSNGREVAQTQRVSVRANATILVTFGAATPE